MTKEPGEIVCPWCDLGDPCERHPNGLPKPTASEAVTARLAPVLERLSHALRSADGKRGSPRVRLRVEDAANLLAAAAAFVEICRAQVSSEPEMASVSVERAPMTADELP